MDPARGVEARICRMAVGSAVLQALLHGGSVVAEKDPRLLPPHGVAFLGDVGLLFLVTLLALGLVRWSRLPRGLAGAGPLLLGLTGVVLASYPMLLREFLAFPADLFAADAASARTFLVDYLGIARLWPPAVAAGLFLLLLRAPWDPRRRRVLAGLGLLGLAGLPAVLRASPHPLLFSVQEQVKSAISAGPRAVPSLGRPVKVSRPADVQGALPDPPLAASRFKKVLLLVLEGIRAQDFEAEFLARPDGFHAQVQHQARYFRAYRTTNLDSYTSLIAMVSAVQVPYRAYADEGLYRGVQQADNLARRLRQQGFWTLFLSTYEHQPFIPCRGDWDRVLDRRDLGPLEGWRSLGSSRMEAATEDRAALPVLVDQISSRPRAFVLQELVYGHSPQWQAATGLSPVRYCDGYLQDLWGRLKARGLDRETLLVVVSDHGDRSQPSQAGNYRVPLYIVGQGLAPGTEQAFYSHLDLPALVGAVLLGRPLPAGRTQQVVVGSTDRWTYGVVQAGGGHLFLDDVTGRVLARQGPVEPGRLHQAFREYLGAFHSRYGP